MKVKRVYEKDVKNFKEGDQIQLGKYTATAVKEDGKYMLFCLDQYLDKPYKQGKNFLENINVDIIRDENFEEIWRNRDLLGDFLCADGFKHSFRVPYAGEFFNGTEEDEWIREYYEPDVDGKFLDIWECMKNRRNRIAERDGETYEWGWLMNPIKGQNIVSATNFATVYGSGNTNHSGASYSIGVRPVFRLKRHLV